MKLLITTQVRENYGAHDWDGTGECPQYWKFKGGNEYLVLNVEPSLRAEAVTSFRILALGLPVVVLTSALIGILEAYQRFGAYRGDHGPARGSDVRRPLAHVAIHAEPDLGHACSLRKPFVCIGGLLPRRMFSE